MRTPLGSWITRNPVFACVLVIAVVIRVMTMGAYSPALFFSDSWGYLYAAYTHRPIAVSYQRPYGYPLLLLILSAPGRDLFELVGFQHLAGLISGALVYLVLVRAGVNRHLAAVLSALVLLDGYRLTLEQYVMPESFFTLTLLASLLVLAWPYLNLGAAAGARGGAGRPVALSPFLSSSRRSPRSAGSRAELGLTRAACAGLLLAAASVQRQAAIFLIPVVIIYLIWRRARWGSALAFTLALVIPILCYWGINEAKLGIFGFTANNGWTLYGRVASFADCAKDGIPTGERALCPAKSAHDPAQPTFYIWDSASPAVKMFPQGQETVAAEKRTNAILDSFADKVIEHQPLDYLGATLGDFLRYFTPGATPFEDDISATALPRTAADERMDEQRRRELIPSVEPHVSWPASIIRAYRSVIHVPRWGLVLLVLASLLALVRRVPARREIVLLVGGALLMLLGTAATAGFGLRYLLPVVPFLLIGGGLALSDLLGAPEPRSRVRGQTLHAVQA